MSKTKKVIRIIGGVLVAVAALLVIFAAGGSDHGMALNVIGRYILAAVGSGVVGALLLYVSDK